MTRTSFKPPALETAMARHVTRQTVTRSMAAMFETVVCYHPDNCLTFKIRDVMLQCRVCWLGLNLEGKG